MLDNIAGLLLMVGLLDVAFGFPTKFALQHMVPGTAIGVLVGDLLFFVMALRLARRSGRQDVTAMPLGLDTPSTIGMVFFVLGPAYAQAQATMDIQQAAEHTWHIGICAIFISGLFKLLCAGGSHWLRTRFPRAALLGSLAAIALVLISFLPLLEILHYPLVGLVSLGIILTTLVARLPLPGQVPGALGALLVGGAMFYLLQWTGWLDAAETSSIVPREALLPTGWLSAWQFEWLAALDDTLPYLPVVIPFALATVVGGIDCTESAAAVGDEYRTGRVIAVEGVATLAAALCGGVIQTTPYIGHPAYKAMGGRAAYTLATALFVGTAGLFGYFGYLYMIVPKVTVFPILVFIGLEITAQSFHATPRRHYPAVALACVPALAALAMIFANKLLGELTAQGGNPAAMNRALQQELQTLQLLANGFIVTSLLWGAALAALIDQHLYRGAAFFAAAGGLSLCGVMHSPLPGGAVFLPWQLTSEAAEISIGFGAGYLSLAGLLCLWRCWLGPPQQPPVDEEPLP